mmetsp:Transcript_59997/g.186050  ORF Transcript_59997/g.186050 Transcript_59997/m.186050 type:complete len:119 (+) Transcript_59997:53-409(+)
MDGWDDDEEYDNLISPLDARSRGGRSVSSAASAAPVGRACPCPLLAPSASASSWPEFLQAVETQLYYSRFTSALYATTFLLAGILLATTLGFETPLQRAPRTLWLLEALVSLSLWVEV